MGRRFVRTATAALAAVGLVIGTAACTAPADPDGGDPTKITMLVLGDKPTNGHLEAMLEKLNERLTEEANATLDLFYIEWAD